MSKTYKQFMKEKFQILIFGGGQENYMLDYTLLEQSNKYIKHFLKYSLKHFKI